MKRNPIAAVGLLMAMTCTSRTSMAAGKNHVPNGTFDTDISGWIPRPAGGCSGFFGGVCWSRLGAPNTLESGSANLAATPFFVPVATLTSSCFPVHGGERYTFRVAGTGGQAEAILSWSDDSECQSSPASDTILVNARSGINWTYFQNAVTAPVEAVAAHVLLRAVEPNRVGFDDVRLIRDRSGTMTTTTIACEGDCGDPLSGTIGASVTPSDALYILQAAIGQQACAPCICDVNDDGGITAIDALLALAVAAGEPVILTCPAP